MKTHPTFHVVMPSRPVSAKFYDRKQARGPRLVPPHREHPEAGVRLRQPSGGAGGVQEKKSPSKLKARPSFMETVKNQPVLSKEEIVAETKASLQRAISRDGGKPAGRKERRASETQQGHKPVVKRQRSHAVKEPEVKESPKPPDTKSLRSTVVKGVKDVLAEKVDSCTDLKVEPERIHKIAEEIEIAMFGIFGEAGMKYKNKYRSLVYNIKDQKNDGLFRRILLRDLSPIEVQWEQASRYISIVMLRSELCSIYIHN